MNTFEVSLTVTVQGTNHEEAVLWLSRLVPLLVGADTSTGKVQAVLHTEVKKVVSL